MTGRQLYTWTDPETGERRQQMMTPDTAPPGAVPTYRRTGSESGIALAQTPVGPQPQQPAPATQVQPQPQANLRQPLTNTPIFPGVTGTPENFAGRATNQVLFGEPSAPRWGSIPFSMDWFSDLGTNIGNLFRDEPVAQAPAPPPPPPPLNFEFGLNPDQEDIINRMLANAGRLAGAGDPGQAPTLPDAPTYSVDPGLRTMATHQQERAGDIQAILGQLMADQKDQDPRNRNRWQRFAEYLGELGASGDLAQAGAIMSRLRQRDEQWVADYQNRVAQLTLQGYAAEDAAVMAQAELESGVHQAGERTTEAAYDRDTRQTGLDSQYQLAGAANAGQNTRAGIDLENSILAMEYEFLNNNREQAQQIYRSLAGDPQRGEEYAAASLPQGLPQETAQAIARTMVEDQRFMGLASYIQANLGNTEALTDFLQQFDPNIVDRDVENALASEGGALGLAMRALNGANAQTAFANNPNLSRWARYSGAQ